jgi:hypothetical protein
LTTKAATPQGGGLRRVSGRPIDLGQPEVAQIDSLYPVKAQHSTFRLP